MLMLMLYGLTVVLATGRSWTRVLRPLFSCSRNVCVLFTRFKIHIIIIHLDDGVYMRVYLGVICIISQRALRNADDDPYTHTHTRLITLVERDEQRPVFFLITTTFAWGLAIIKYIQYVIAMMNMNEASRSSPVCSIINPLRPRIHI